MGNDRVCLPACTQCMAVDLQLLQITFGCSDPRWKTEPVLTELGRVDRDTCQHGSIKTIQLKHCVRF